MKGNESKWAFICFQQFFRIGTFQRVTADSNKENRGPPDSHLRLCETPAARRPLALGHDASGTRLLPRTSRVAREVTLVIVDSNF